MRQTLRTIAILALALAAALAARHWLIATCTVPDGTLQPRLHQGQWVVLSKLAPTKPRKGDIVLFDGDSTSYLGRIELCPGDTLTLGDTLHYVIPDIKRCPHCGSTHPRNYLVSSGQRQTLVHETHISARLLLALPWP